MPNERYCISFIYNDTVFFYTRDGHGRGLHNNFNGRKPFYHTDKEILIGKMLYCLEKTRDDLPKLQYEFISELEMKIMIAEWKLKNA